LRVRCGCYIGHAGINATGVRALASGGAPAHGKHEEKETTQEFARRSGSWNVAKAFQPAAAGHSTYCVLKHTKLART